MSALLGTKSGRLERRNLAVSDQAKATLVYLGETWLVIANVADVAGANQLHQPLADDPLHLSPE